MTYMDPRPEGLNTEKAPESIVETLKMPDNNTVTFDALRLAFEKEHDMLALEWNPLGFYEDHLTQAYWEGAVWSAEHAPAAQGAGQEPSAYVRHLPNSVYLDSTGCKTRWEDLPDGTPVYANTAPVSAGQEVVAITDAEILGVWALHDLKPEPDSETILSFARDILAAPVNGGERACTCHADDRPNECQHRYAASECQRAADAPQVGGGIQRYGAFMVDRYPGDGSGERETDVQMKPQQNGEWVKYDDHVAALTSPAKVGGDEREAFIDKCIRLLEASRHAARVVGIEHIEAFPYLPEYDEAVDWLNENRAALSADGGEESPSLTNPLTPYGMLGRALRIVADTTLMEMSQRCGMTPSYLSSLEFGRKAVTNDDATSAAVFFASKGIEGTLGLLQAAISANQARKGE